MPEDKPKIIVDDDWKAQAQAEKERLEQETAQPQALPEPGFAEVLNLIAMQAMVGLGLVATGPGGERIPPNLEIAKHFIDMLQVLDDKTKNNLTAEEKTLLDELLYDLRMRYVHMAGAGVAPSRGGTGGAAS